MPLAPSLSRTLTRMPKHPNSSADKLHIPPTVLDVSLAPEAPLSSSAIELLPISDHDLKEIKAIQDAKAEEAKLVQSVLDDIIEKEKVTDASLVEIATNIGNDAIISGDSNAGINTDCLALTQNKVAPDLNKEQIASDLIENLSSVNEKNGNPLVEKLDEPNGNL